MAGDLPPASGQGPTPPSPMQWGAPPFPIQQPPRRAWLAAFLASVAVLLGAAALIVTLTRPTSSASSAPSISSTAPSYTAEQTAAAHKQLCDTYKLAAHAVQIDTNGDNPAFAGITTVNAAVMLEQAVNSVSALSPGDRAAALALAAAYSNAQATASLVQTRDDPAWRAVSDEANTKDAAMKKVCGSG
ncbi:hypothetical protein [Mycobacterium intracellulare]|uniref:hypothetical protein n=1 Tax=Mycobacterium intracellulare TaxID=1767 RepID=UPI0009DB887B